MLFPVDPRLVSLFLAIGSFRRNTDSTSLRFRAVPSIVSRKTTVEAKAFLDATLSLFGNDLSIFAEFVRNVVPFENVPGRSGRSIPSNGIFLIESFGCMGGNVGRDIDRRRKGGNGFRGGRRLFSGESVCSGDFVFSFPVSSIDLLSELASSGESFRSTEEANLVFDAVRKSIVEDIFEGFITPTDLSGQGVELHEVASNPLSIFHF